VDRLRARIVPKKLFKKFREQRQAGCFMAQIHVFGENLGSGLSAGTPTLG
jgi:hypothetical protein